MRQCSMSTWEALQEKAANLNLFLEDWQRLKATLEEEPVWRARHSVLLGETRQALFLEANSLLAASDETVQQIKEAAQFINKQVTSTQDELKQHSVLSAVTQQFVDETNRMAERLLETTEELRSNFIGFLNLVREAGLQPPLDDDMSLPL
jgi:hypothetical protein